MHSTQNLNLPRPSSWYYENGYLTIDLELFSKYLSALFSKYLGKPYYFQKCTPRIETTKNRPIWYQEQDSKNLAIIGPTLYDKSSGYNKKRFVDVNSSKPNYLVPYTSYSKEYPSLFSKSPLKIDDEDFLIYFGDYSYDYVSVPLGTIENGQFIPNDFSRPIISRVAFSSGKEIEYSQKIYPFIKDFISEIFYYKIVNIKPSLTEADMELILTEFGIKRKEILEHLLMLFKSLNHDITTSLLGSTTVDEACNKNK